MDSDVKETVPGRSAQPFSVELQSIRGMAALVVTILHCGFYYAYDLHLRRMVEIVFNAHAAVTIFFVLSGFVLSLSLVGKAFTFENVVGFYTRRAYRLYPMLVVAVFLALLYPALFSGCPLPAEVSPWWWPGFRSFPEEPLGYLTSVLALRTTLPLPIWTLSIEGFASLLMPFLVLALRRPSWFALALALMVVNMLTGFWNRGLLGIYLPCFFMGAAIIPLAGVVRARMPSCLAQVIVASIAVIALWFGRLIVPSDFALHYHAPIAALIEACSATVIILMVWVHGNIVPVLRSRPWRWLGNISYSLYLLHFPLIGLVAGIGGEMLRLQIFLDGGFPATLALVIVVVPASLVLSTLSYRYVEMPMVALGRRVSRRIGGLARQDRSVKPAVA